MVRPFDRAAAAPAGDPGAGRLRQFGEALLQRDAGLFDEWFLQRHLNLELDCGEIEGLQLVHRRLMDNALGQAQLMTHRDFMPRNLMPVDGPAAGFPGPGARPDRLRRGEPVQGRLPSWPLQRVDEWLAQYHERARDAGLPVPDRATFLRDADWMGIQRHVKILGLFCRLRYRDNKGHYLDDAPRFITYLDEVLPRYRELAPLQQLLDERIKPALAELGAPMRVASMKALVLPPASASACALTLHTPKPLLEVAGKPLIVWHLERLAALGVREVVINTAWLAEQFPATLGDGSQWGLRLHFLYEGRPRWKPAAASSTPCRCWAMPRSCGERRHLDRFRFRHAAARAVGPGALVLVDNPVQHPNGDPPRCTGCLHHDREGPCLTYAGIGVYRPSIVADWRTVIGDAPGSERLPPKFSVVPLQKHFMAQGLMTGQHHRGRWTDVGTVDRLRALDAELAANG
jgi:hypothetical protein